MRRQMRLDLTRALAPEASGPAPRRLTRADAAPLAELMLEAYRGAPDDEGEGPAEARAEVDRTFDGGYGTMSWEASFAIDFDDRPAIAAATVVTFWRDVPLLAFSCTHPAAQRRGLAGRLIRESARALARAGHVRLELVVTLGNTPAERLYEKLGFVAIEQA